MAEPKKEESARELLGQLGEDYVRNEIFDRTPQAVVGGVSGAILLRELAQRGTVPGAAKRAVAAKVMGKAGMKLAGKLAGPGGVLVDLGQAVNKVLTPPTKEAFEEDERLGGELVKKPLWFQAGNAAISPTDAMSQYGALGQREARAAVADENSMWESRLKEVDEREGRGRDYAAENRQAEIAEMGRSVGMDDEETRRLAQEAFEEDNLEAISLEKVKNYLNSTK